MKRGTYGTVFPIDTDEYNIPVAIKRIDIANIHSIVRELCMMLSLRNDNIIRCITYKVTNNNVDIYMEYADGDLNDYINRNGPVSNTLFAKWAHQLLNGLAHIHINDIIHRDIKPQNVLLFGNNVKLCDFGMAIPAYKSSTFYGTISYSPPESITQQRFITKSSDIWALGATLYAIRYGHNLFSTSLLGSTVSLHYMFSKATHQRWPYDTDDVSIAPPIGITLINDANQGDIIASFILSLLRIDYIRPLCAELLIHPIFNNMKADDMELVNVIFSHVMRYNTVDFLTNDANLINMIKR